MSRTEVKFKFDDLGEDDFELRRPLWFSRYHFDLRPSRLSFYDRFSNLSPLSLMFPPEHGSFHAPDQPSDEPFVARST